jgi:hypothetical protein
MPRFTSDSRIVAVAAGGSYGSDAMDEFSDLDLVVVVEPAEQAAVLADRQGIADSLGSLLAAFTGEHVGEPRLLICLYGAPLLHVDLKFVALSEMAKRVEEPAVLWERDGRLTAVLRCGHAEYPAPDPQWVEDRFWVWIHYAAGKIGRGELFEAIDCLAFIRSSALGPLGLRRSGARPAGVRKIEGAAPVLAEQLRRTVPAYDARDCVRALRASADVYRQLRGNPGAAGVRLQSAAEAAAMDYLADIERRCGQ